MGANKDKGTRAETAIVRYLQSEGFEEAKRIDMGGPVSMPDIEVVEGLVVVQSKNVKAMALAEWVDDATKQAANFGVQLGVVWHHRKGKGQPSDWYVTMSGEMYVRHLHELTGW